MQRRVFLKVTGTYALLLPTAQNTFAITNKKIHYYSACADARGRYYISGFNDNGHHLFDTPLPSRGHALAIHPHKHHITAVARRPDTYLIVINAQTGNIIFQQESPENRHFYGHSIYSHDGRWLYTTENDIDSGQGKIGVWDVNAGYHKVAEHESYGIGPHELLLLSDHTTLVVANGGILTRPETGRSKLNLDTMSPSLAYIDRRNGKLIEQHKLPAELHQNSIRHLAINQHDQVCFVMQYQGSADKQPPLVGLHQRGQSLNLLRAPTPIQKQMKLYCGSVCSDISGNWFAVSSPKGDIITFWSARHQQYTSSINVEDGCGIARSSQDGEFLISSGNGDVFRYQIGDKKMQAIPSPSKQANRWDNHMTQQKI